MESVQRVESENLPRRSVLLVEDDAELLGVLSAGLQLHGFEVTTASSARGALEMVPGSGLRFDVMVTDIELGDGWGASLAVHLQPHQPDMKVVFMSGHVSHDPLLREGIQDHMVFLAKPFSVRHLVRVLREVLGDWP